MTRPVRLEVAGWGWRHAGRRAWAVRGVDVVVEPGERVLLLGPSGSGKSTLLAGVTGLLDEHAAAEYEGAVRLDGAPAARDRSQVGLVMQDPESSLVMSRVGDDVAFGLENRGVPEAEIWPRVDEALEVVGLGRYRRQHPTAQLSGGEQQRLALAGALAARPGLLVLDEPTANLDPAGARQVRDVLRTVLDRTGATMLLVEHRVDAVLDLVDRVLVLAPGGGIVVDGPPHRVFAEHGAALVEAGVWVPGSSLVSAPRSHRAAGSDGRAVALRGEGLTYRYDPGLPAAVDDVDFELVEGQAIAVTGPNGSGKSTLALLLAGLVAPTQGRVLVPGRPGRPLHRWRARDLVRQVGKVFQDPEHQFVTGRVVDELTLGPRRAGSSPAAARHRADELLVRLHLHHLAAANPFTLSGGEQRRLSVATALATAPPVLVLDEPTFGQDARTWRELLSLCASLRDEGRALLAVTHDEPFATALADRRVDMVAGRLRVPEHRT